MVTVTPLISVYLSIHRPPPYRTRKAAILPAWIWRAGRRMRTVESDRHQYLHHPHTARTV